jgi:hypothetical protein
MAQKELSLSPTSAGFLLGLLFNLKKEVTCSSEMLLPTELYGITTQQHHHQIQLF